MVVDGITGILKGPQGPEPHGATNDLFGTRPWGKYFEEAFAGNDDEDVVEKTRIMWKHAFPLATGLLIYDVQMFNRTGGVVNVLQRMKWHYLRWGAPMLAYTSIVCCTSALRGGKTDQKNHLVGGFAAGAVLGHFNKSVIGGGVMGFFLGLLGWYYKDSKMNGYEVFPAIWEQPARHGNQFTHKLDFTGDFFAPRPGYWARSEADVERVFKQGQLGDGNSQRKWW